MTTQVGVTQENQVSREVVKEIMLWVWGSVAFASGPIYGVLNNFKVSKKHYELLSDAASTLVKARDLANEILKDVENGVDLESVKVKVDELSELIAKAYDLVYEVNNKMSGTKEWATYLAKTRLEYATFLIRIFNMLTQTKPLVILKD